MLVVDDDDQHRLSLAMACHQGYEVAEASDGNAAIEYLLWHRPPSVILLDLMMPTVSGWTFSTCYDGTFASTRFR